MIMNKYLMMAIAVFASLALFACSDDSTSGLDDIDDDDDTEEVEPIYYGFTVDVEGGETFTFVVDLTDLEDFDTEDYSVYISGSPFDWPEPGTVEDLEMTLMDDEDDLPESSGVVVEAGEAEYKYFSDFIGEGWDGGEWEAGANRVVEIESGESTLDEWGDEPTE